MEQTFLHERCVFMKDQYVLQINELLQQCNDMALLDLVLKILDKGIK